MKTTSLQHYRPSTIRFDLHVCINIFPNNWKFLKLYKNPSSNILVYNSHCFNIVFFATYVYLYNYEHVWCHHRCHLLKQINEKEWCPRSWKSWKLDIKNKSLWWHITWLIWLWRTVVCLFVCCVELLQTMAFTFLVSLESLWWIGVHGIGLIMFWPMVEKLLNIE